MRKVTFGAACSLDGFIARPDHSVDWLRWSKDVSALTNAYWKTIDTVVMGRKSYVVSAKSGGGGYPGVTTYVFSRTLNEANPDVKIIAEEAATFLTGLKQQAGKGICVMGGGELASDLFNAGLIDEVGLNIHPIMLGSGIPMFPRVARQVDLELIDAKPLDGGCVYVIYRIRRS